VRLKALIEIGHSDAPLVHLGYGCSYRGCQLIYTALATMRFIGRRALTIVPMDVAILKATCQIGS
jgi:hypothetical protein